MEKILLSMHQMISEVCLLCVCLSAQPAAPAAAAAAGSGSGSGLPAAELSAHDEHERPHECPAAPAENEAPAHPDGARAHPEETGRAHETGVCVLERELSHKGRKLLFSYCCVEQFMFLDASDPTRCHQSSLRG